MPAPAPNARASGLDGENNRAHALSLHGGVIRVIRTPPACPVGVSSSNERLLVCETDMRHTSLAGRSEPGNAIGDADVAEAGGFAVARSRWSVSRLATFYGSAFSI